MNEGIYEARPLTADSATVLGKPPDRFFGAKTHVPDWYPETTKWSELLPPKALGNCMFVYPGITSPGWDSCQKGQTSNEAVYMSHGMAYVSSALKSRGHLAWLLDMRTCKNWKDFEQKVREAEYDVAFIGFLSLDVFTATCAVRSLREIHPDRPVIVGGLHVSCCEMMEFPSKPGQKYYLPDLYLNRDQEMHPMLRTYLDYKGERSYDPAKFPQANHVIWNEAEIAASKAVEELISGNEVPPFINAHNVPDLNETPHADRDLFNLEYEANAPLLDFLPKPFFTVTFGRGCPFKCSFCNVGTQLSSARVRLISPDYFMDELQQLHDRFGKIGSLMIHDDILLYPKWLEEWNTKLLARFGYTPYWCQMRADFICKNPELMALMASAGLAWVSIGLESGSQKQLDMMGKQTTVAQNIESCRILRDLGVNVFGNWMLGLPDETHEQRLETAAMMAEVAKGGIRHSASVYCNYPGTSLERYIDMKGMLLPSWYTRSHFPWQRALKDIDYADVYKVQSDVTGKYPNRATKPRFWKDK